MGSNNTIESKIEHLASDLRQVFLSMKVIHGKEVERPCKSMQGQNNRICQND